MPVLRMTGSGNSSRRAVERLAVRKALNKEFKDQKIGLDLDSMTLELMLRQRTDERLKELAERRQPPIAKKQISCH